MQAYYTALWCCRQKNLNFSKLNLQTLWDVTTVTEWDSAQHLLPPEWFGNGANYWAIFLKSRSYGYDLLLLSWILKAIVLSECLQLKCTILLKHPWVGCSVYEVFSAVWQCQRQIFLLHWLFYLISMSLSVAAHSYKSRLKIYLWISKESNKYRELRVLSTCPLFLTSPVRALSGITEEQSTHLWYLSDSHCQWVVKNLCYFLSSVI